MLDFKEQDPYEIMLKCVAYAYFVIENKELSASLFRIQKDILDAIQVMPPEKILTLSLLSIGLNLVQDLAKTDSKQRAPIQMYITMLECLLKRIADEPALENKGEITAFFNQAISQMMPALPPSIAYHRD